MLLGEDETDLKGSQTHVRQAMSLSWPLGAGMAAPFTVVYDFMHVSFPLLHIVLLFSGY